MKETKVLGSKAPYYFTGDSINFCWLNYNKENVLETVEKPYTCKDYLTDCIYSTVRNTTLEFDPTILPVNKKETTILFYIPPNFTNKLEQVQKVLNGFEKYHRIKRSKITKAVFLPNKTEIPNYTQRNWYVLTGSSRWMTNTFIASAYLSLFRLAFIAETDNWEDIEKNIHANRYNGTVNDISLIKTYSKDRLFTKILKNIKVWNVTYKQGTTYRSRVTGYYYDSVAGHSSVGIFFYLQYKDTHLTRELRWKNYLADRMSDFLNKA